MIERRSYGPAAGERRGRSRKRVTALVKRLARARGALTVGGTARAQWRASTRYARGRLAATTIRSWSTGAVSARIRRGDGYGEIIPGAIRGADPLAISSPDATESSGTEPTPARHSPAPSARES